MDRNAGSGIGCDRAGSALVYARRDAVTRRLYTPWLPAQQPSARAWASADPAGSGVGRPTLADRWSELRRCLQDMDAAAVPTSRTSGQG